MEQADFGLSEALTDRLRAWYDAWDAENLYESVGVRTPRNGPGRLRVPASPSNFDQRSKPSLTRNTTGSGPDTTDVP